MKAELGVTEINKGGRRKTLQAEKGAGERVAGPGNGRPVWQEQREWGEWGVEARRVGRAHRAGLWGCPGCVVSTPQAGRSRCGLGVLAKSLSGWYR